ncbi:hypothetical protein [Micromonospora schwarzwaldensis]|uniref:hypothetical protein n=1 Tax=Micromonospora sp. DSM 45708 TaxID=3111767 RepID=UPI0031E222C9
MGTRRRKNPPRKSQAATNTSTPELDRSKEYTNAPRSTTWATLGRDHRRPIPIPLVAAITLPATILLGLKFSNYIACPQQTQGEAHVITSIAVGLAIGGGVTAILMIAVTLGVMVERLENSVSAVRVALERAGIGAIYGTSISTLATLHLEPGDGCEPQLLSNISNGATWGSMLGFALSILTLRKQMIADSKIAKSARDRFYLRSLSASAILFGATITLSVTSKLLSGDVFPS